jgi:hypothetical protein
MSPAEDQRGAEVPEDLHGVLPGRADAQRPGGLGRMKLEVHAASWCSRSMSLPRSKRAPSRTISSITDGEPPFPPSWPDPSPGTTVSIGSYLPGRRANAGHCLRLDTVTGKVHPFPADPQVSSIAWPAGTMESGRRLSLRTSLRTPLGLLFD